MPSVSSSSYSPPSTPHSSLSNFHPPSISQDRRFHRRFPQVDPRDRLVNYYSCALVGDILLQGHLYVTESFFAFYSNIFGYKTQLLVTVSDVIKVTKERTAKIIPNAVGVYTPEGRYVFASLLSRDATYRLMHEIWLQSADLDLSLQDDTESENNSPLLPNATEDCTEDEESLSGTSGRDTPEEPTTSSFTDAQEVLPPVLPSRPSEVVNAAILRRLSFDDRATTNWSLKAQGAWVYTKGCINKVEEVTYTISRLPRTSLLLLISTVLVVVLFMSASILMYRIAIIHRRLALSTTTTWSPSHEQWVNSYMDLHKRQHQELNEEVARLTKSLKERIHQLTQVWHSLDELLSMASQLPDLCQPPKVHSTAYNPRSGSRSSSWLSIQT